MLWEEDIWVDCFWLTGMWSVCIFAVMLPWFISQVRSFRAAGQVQIPEAGK